MRPGPYELVESSAAVTLEGPTLQINAGDGSLVLAASTHGGGRRARNDIEEAADLAVAALNGAGGQGDSDFREALEQIVSDDVTSAKAAKEIARAALGDE